MENVYRIKKCNFFTNNEWKKILLILLCVIAKKGDLKSKRATLAKKAKKLLSDFK